MFGFVVYEHTMQTMTAFKSGQLEKTKRGVVSKYTTTGIGMVIAVYAKDEDIMRHQEQVMYSLESQQQEGLSNHVLWCMHMLHIEYKH